MAQTAATRTKKRVLKSLDRKGEGQSSVPSTSRLLHARMAQLEMELHRLGEAFDQNTDVFSQSLKMCEANDVVMQRVLQEHLVLGGPVYRDAMMNPNWREYLRQYWLCMLFTDFVDWLKSLAPPPPLEEDTVITKPDDEHIVETHIFGG